MNKEPLISIIVPVFNVEQYINRCIESIICQTFSNFELLLIDDGSPDNSGKICDEWKLKDTRIRVFHKTNGGLSDARNFGVLNSSGSFITFIDSDDYISKNYLSYLYTILEKYNADISMCYFKNTPNSDLFSQNSTYSEDKIECLSAYESCIRFCTLPQYGVSVCKLYKKELLLNNPFPIKRFFEDTATIGKILYSAEKIAVGTQQLYAYYQNLEGITHSLPSKKKREDQLWAITENALFFKEKKEKKIEKNAWKLLAPVILLQYKSGELEKEIIKYYYESYKENATFSLMYLKVICTIQLPFFYMFFKKLKHLF